MKEYRLTAFTYVGLDFIGCDTLEEVKEEAKNLAYAGCTPHEVYRYNATSDTYELIGRFTKR